MNYELLFKSAKNAGIEDLEVYVQSHKETEFNIYKGDMDSFKVAESIGLAARGIYNGKMGNTFTEIIDDSMIDFIIQQIKENATAISSSDLVELYFDEDTKYENLHLYNESLDDVPLTKKIELVKELEKRIYEVSSKIYSVRACVYSEQVIETTIKNSRGLDLHRKGNVCFVYVNCIAKEGNDTKSALEFKITNNFNELNIDEMVQKVTDQAMRLLGATTLESGEYELILENKVSADLLSAMSSMFSAERVQKGVSLLKEQLHQKVFSELITIVDDPHIHHSYKSTPFDDEGYPTRKKELVQNGVLSTYLHNIKTAAKDGVQSTGNGFKATYASSVNVLPTNLYIKEGPNSFESLVSNTKKGIIITSLAGLHSGLNTITGDFSLQASGYLVEDGIIIRPITLFTIAGNYIHVLNDVEAIGNDLKQNSNRIGSPSLKIKKIMVSGK